MRPIAYEIDIYQADKVSTFEIIDTIVPGMNVPGVLLINAGRVLVFSMITGQLVRIVVDPNNPTKGFSDIVFAYFCPSPKGLAYAANNKHLFHVELKDNNEEADRHRTRKEF